ncbi:MAG: mobilization protein C [Alphaproteobacteria bacterium]|nr:mobilization protein C [Alphaproteobacteria bacterium]MBU1607529.1 mobilization protein C [Alphaproteobacteria bacterium]
MAPPRKTPDEKLAELHQKKARLEAQISSERARLRQAERKRDTRRKIIAGAVVLEHASQNPQFRDHLNGLLRRNVTRPQDLELFELDNPPDPNAHTTEAP